MSEAIEIGEVVTGNRLTDGAVVFLSQAGTWETAISQAAVTVEPLASAALAKRGEQALKDNVLTEFYLIKVSGSGQTVRPLVRRERIRAAGPTVRLDLARNDSLIIDELAAA